MTGFVLHSNHQSNVRAEQKAPPACGRTPRRQGLVRHPVLGFDSLWGGIVWCDVTLACAGLAAVWREYVMVSPRSSRLRRRQFDPECKARVLAEYEAAGPGERGVLLGREGL